MVIKRRKGRPALGDFLAAVDSVDNNTAGEPDCVEKERENNKAIESENVINDVKCDATCDKVSDKKDYNECDIESDKVNNEESDKVSDIKSDKENDRENNKESDKEGDGEDNKADDKESSAISDSSKDISQNVNGDGQSNVSTDIDDDYAVKVVNEYMSLYLYELAKKTMQPRKLRTRYVDNHKRITMYFRNDNVKKIESFKKSTGLDQSSIVNMALDLFFRMLSDKKLVDEIKKRKQ